MAVSFAPQNSNKDRLNIDILIYFQGKRFKRTTGQSVPKEFWNKQQQKCSENRTHFPAGISINKALKKTKEAAEQSCNFFTENLIVPTKDQFFRKMDEFLYGVDMKKRSFLSYMYEYIDSRKNIRQETTIRTYNSVMKLLERYEQKNKLKLEFTHINNDLYKHLQNYMYSLGYSTNYFGRTVKLIKIVFNDARRNGLHNLPELEGFKVEDHTADAIYLNLEELQRIYELPLTNKTESLVRAKFLIGAYTGLRVSDFNNLDKNDIKERYIVVTTQKTGEKIFAPINSIVREIISSVDITKPVSDDKINSHIKSIARKAGITESIKITHHVSGKRISRLYEKCDLVKSHTARRSFATNAYLAGVPTLSIMKITGHANEKSFRRYIKISQEENAELMLKHEFFK